MKNNIFKYVTLMLLAFSATSCLDYLDRDIESELTQEDVMKDFAHAQGYVDMMYWYVVNYAQSGNQNDGSSFMLGDENITTNTSMTSGAWDLGAFSNYKTGYFKYNGDYVLDGVTNVLLMGHAGIWDGWEAIRMANMVISSEDMMTGCTQTEKDLLLGQAYFFRAFFHMEILKFWGAIPYVDVVLTGNDDDYKLTRPDTYYETAMRIDEDFDRAIELLPTRWDDLENDPDATFLTFKESTFGNTLMMINKIIAYSFKGKNLLLAASPLMIGSTDTYEYDADLCAQAAEALAHVIAIDREDTQDLGLATAENLWKVFYTLSSTSTYWVGTSDYVGTNQGEYIFSSAGGHINGGRAIATATMPYTTISATGRQTPTHSFIHKTFGTANGLSCDEDPSHDFQSELENRDPRFYATHFIDGDVAISNALADDTYKWIQIFKGGVMDAINNPTGYFVKKWADVTYNYSGAVLTGGYDNEVWNGNAFWLSMRLTDVYLMYAEALAASSYGATGTPSYSFLSDVPSSVDVIDMLRARWDVPSVEVAYSSIGVDIASDREKYIDVVRRERAAELCYEGHRWTDIRRWMLAHLDEYRKKTGLDYYRDQTTTLGDRTTFTNINFSERLIRTRTCEYPKHFWLPFPTDMTLMYEGFEQNPGW